MAPPNTRGRSRHVGLRAAFSLTELLVVGTIVGLLLALGGPSLQAMREKSKQSVCLDRLQGIATASRVYAAESPHSSSIPVHPLQFMQTGYDVTYVGAYEWGGKSGVGDPCFVPGPCTGVYAPITSKYGTKAGFGPAWRPMNAILYPGGFRNCRYPDFNRFCAMADTELDLDLYRCPADNGPPSGAHCMDWIEHPERSSYDHFGNSYAANVFMTSYAGGGVVRSNSPYMRPMSRILTPARTILYEENIGRWAWGCRREQCDFIQPGVSPGPTGAVPGWHGKDWTFNRAFGDTHAERQKVYLEGTEDAEGYALHYRSEIIYGDSPYDLAKQEQERCIIVRGDGWQKDTLPAEPIVTGLSFGGGGGRVSDENCANHWRDRKRSAPPAFQARDGSANAGPAR